MEIKYLYLNDSLEAVSPCFRLIEARNEGLCLCSLIVSGPILETALNYSISPITAWGFLKLYILRIIAK
jgi:hypothetical protein